MPRLDGSREGSSGLRVVLCRVLLCLFRQRVHTSNRICSLLVRRLRLPLPGLLSRGTEIAPGNDDTLRSLEDLPLYVIAFQRIQSISDLLLSSPWMNHRLQKKTLPFARRGAAGGGRGPSGMIYEYLRPLLDNPRDVQRLHQLGERFARAEVPQLIVDAVRMGRITALRKPDGVSEALLLWIFPLSIRPLHA